MNEESKFEYLSNHIKLINNCNYFKNIGVVNVLKQASKILHQSFFQISNRKKANNSFKYPCYPSSTEKPLRQLSLRDDSSDYEQSKRPISVEQDFIDQGRTTSELLSQVRSMINTVPHKRRSFLNLWLYYTLDDYENSLKSLTLDDECLSFHDEIIAIMELALNQEELSNTQFIIKTLPKYEQFDSQEKFKRFLDHFLAFDSKLKSYHLTDDEQKAVEDNMTKLCLLACCMNTSFLTPRNYRRVRKYENRMLSCLNELSHDKDYYTHITISYIRNNLYRELTQAKILELFQRASQGNLLEPLIESADPKTKKYLVNR